MSEQVRVIYHRRIAQKLGDDYETHELGGEWEFTVPDGAQVQDEYGKAYAVLRTIVDGYMESKATPKVEAQEMYPPKFGPPDTITPSPVSRTTPASPEFVQQAFQQNTPNIPDHAVPRPAEPPPINESGVEFMMYDESARPQDIDPSIPVKVERAKVFKVTKRLGKAPAKIRVGSREHIPGQYMTAKSFDPQIALQLEALQVNDFVDIWGYFEPWRGNDERIAQGEEPMFDLVVQQIKKRAR